MEGKEFLAWIKQTVKEQAERSGSKLDAKQARDRRPRCNRDNFINDGAMPAMKWLADEPAVKKRLLADRLHAEPATTAETRRVRALQALEGKVDEGDLQQVLALALDKQQPHRRCATTRSIAWATSAAPRRCPRCGRWSSSTRGPAAALACR